MRDERVRLGLSQSELAAVGGVSKMTQLNYEKDVRSPDADYLGAVAAKGIDVLYVVTGTRSGAAALEGKQADYLAALDQLSPGAREALQVLVAELVNKVQPEPERVAPSPGWEVRPDLDLALWRTVALSVAERMEAAGPLSPRRLMALVEEGYAHAMRDRAEYAEIRRQRASRVASKAKTGAEGA